MSQARPLSSDDVRTLREELTVGTTPTVWFTASAVGVPEGRSGKVVALDDAEEGDFIQVRPAGSKDVLSFSVGEVTVVKPPRKRKEPGGATSSESGASPAGRGKAAAVPSQAGSGEPPKQEAKSASPAKSGSSGGAAQESGADAERPRGGAAARRKPRQLSGATVTLTADESGQWHVEVNTGKKRALRPTQVSASAVAQAAKALNDDVAKAVEPLIEAARAQQQARVEELQQQLADAERMLKELTE